MTTFTRAFLRTASPNYLRNTRDMPAIVRTPHPRERRIVFKNIDRAGWTTDIDCYLKDGGYEELKKALNMKPEWIVNQVKPSRYRARGCGGLPCVSKLALSS